MNACTAVENRHLKVIGGSSIADSTGKGCTAGVSMDDWEVNVAAFQAERPRLLDKHGSGRVVLMRGGAVAGVFANQEEALRAGDEKFGSGEPWIIEDLRREDADTATDSRACPV